VRGERVQQRGVARRPAAEAGLPDGVNLRDLGEHRLKDLERPERLFQVCAPGLPTDFPALRSLDARPNNLPTQLTPFVGREHELSQVIELLGKARLVTLTGPSGTGKTRLSLEVATRLLTSFADGAFVAFLAPLTDAALMPSEIATAVGAREQGTLPIAEVLAEHLAGKELLLVLDNLKQVLDAAPFAAELLRGTRAQGARDQPGAAAGVRRARVPGATDDPAPPGPPAAAGAARSLRGDPALRAAGARSTPGSRSTTPTPRR
jgi:hypothetical protein